MKSYDERFSVIELKIEISERSSFTWMALVLNFAEDPSAMSSRTDRA